MTETATILRIERLSSFDGEGLRTVVFLKGCPLSCSWCSTPESQRSATEFGVSREKCTGCFACADACPEKALSWETQRFITDPARCTGCCACTAACPTGARKFWGYTATVDEVYREIEKDSLFYFHSGGGVTLSGGECLMQPTFSAALLERCLMHGIGTAVETCGQAPWENVETVLPYTDTLFYDLKHMDDAVHKQITSVGNIRILKNLKQADASDHRFSLVVRMPVVPGLNTEESNIHALGRFCQKLNKLKEIQLLPYHRLGIETYNRMDIQYPLEHIRSPGSEEMQMYTDTLARMGLGVRIGG